MADIKNIGGQPSPVERNVEKLSDDALKLPNQQTAQNTAVGESAVGRGTIGQPIGLPTAEPTTQNALMPDVVTGRDPSQMVAAEKLRANAGHSATEVLLGLNQQPSTPGVLQAPPGNLEILRHLSPAMRRKILRNLLSKQRGQMRRLVAVMRDENRNPQQQGEDSSQNQEENSAEALLTPQPPLAALDQSPPAAAPQPPAVYNRRAVQDLEAATKMLDLLDELLGMQDYALSQMGTFAQG